MNEDEKLFWMFKQVHGEFSGRFSLHIEEDDYACTLGVIVKKMGSGAGVSVRLI